MNYFKRNHNITKFNICFIFHCSFFFFPDIPTAVSLPHFLDADPSLLEDVDGLQPIRKEHESFAIYQQVNYMK